MRKEAERPWSLDEWKRVTDAHGSTVVFDGVSTASGYVPDDDGAIINTRLMVNAVNAHDKALELALAVIYDHHGSSECHCQLCVMAREVLQTTEEVK